MEAAGKLWAGCGLSVMTDHFSLVNITFT